MPYMTALSDGALLLTVVMAGGLAGFSRRRRRQR